MTSKTVTRMEFIGRPFRKDVEDPNVQAQLEILSAETMNGEGRAFVFRPAGGQWHIGAAFGVGSGHTSSKNFVDYFQVGDRPTRAQIALLPAKQEAEEAARALCGRLPEDISGHPDLLPFGHWKIFTVSPEEGQSMWDIAG